jgi:ParB-like chromosome segregation protein Spo0J
VAEVARPEAPRLEGVSIPYNIKQFAEKPNRYLPKSKVRLDKLVATQHNLDKAKVADIASKPVDDGTPPIVGRHKGKYSVLDGHHRVAGAIERGDSYIKVKRIK